MILIVNIVVSEKGNTVLIFTLKTLSWTCCPNKSLLAECWFYVCIFSYESGAATISSFDFSLRAPFTHIENENKSGKIGIFRFSVFPVFSEVICLILLSSWYGIVFFIQPQVLREAIVQKIPEFYEIFHKRGGQPDFISLIQKLLRQSNHPFFKDPLI